MSSLGGYLHLFLSPMRSSKYLPAFGAIVLDRRHFYSHRFILVLLYCFKRFSHQACLTHHYTFPVWNGRIRHLPQLHDCSFPLVSRSGNWPLLNMGRHWFTNWFSYCTAHHYSYCSSLRVANNFLCKCAYWCCVGNDLLQVVQKFSCPNEKHKTGGSCIHRK